MKRGLIIFAFIFSFLQPEVFSQSDGFPYEENEALKDALGKFEEAWYARNFRKAKQEFSRIFSIDTVALYRFGEEGEFLFMGQYQDDVGFHLQKH